MPDSFRSGSNKAALNFEVSSDKALKNLQKFARMVADTWLMDYKMGNETDAEDSNIYSRKVGTLAMMVSTSLTKIGYPAEHVSAGKVAALIKRLVKQSRWRLKQDRAVNTEAPLDDADSVQSEMTSSQVSPRNHERETSDARLREDVFIGSSDSDEDYDEEGDELSDFINAEVSSQRQLPHQHPRGVAAPPAAASRKQKTAASRKEDSEVSSSQRSAAPAAKRLKPTTPAADIEDAPKRQKAAARLDDRPKEKPSTAVARKMKA
jgi:hypothetical protein